MGEPEPGPEPTPSEKLHGCHRRLSEAMSQLAQATDWLENWPADDEPGARFSDNARMIIDGLAQAIDGMSEEIWSRYG